jgi:hypothetical protein
MLHLLVLGGQRQLHDEARAHRGVLFHPDVSAVFLHDAVYDRES